MGDYVKVVYETEPIGKEQIVLYLTTFDIEKYENEKMFKEVKAIATIDAPFGKNTYINTLGNNEFCNYLEQQVNNWVKNFYEPYIQEAKSLIEQEKAIIHSKIIGLPQSNVKGDIVNVAKVECDLINGDVINCGQVVCNTIKGDIENCRVVYENIETRTNKNETKNKFKS